MKILFNLQFIALLGLISANIQASSSNANDNCWTRMMDCLCCCFGQYSQPQTAPQANNSLSSSHTPPMDSLSNQDSAFRTVHNATPISSTTSNSSECSWNQPKETLPRVVQDVAVERISRGSFSQEILPSPSLSPRSRSLSSENIVVVHDRHGVPIPVNHQVSRPNSYSQAIMDASQNRHLRTSFNSDQDFEDNLDDIEDILKDVDFSNRSRLDPIQSSTVGIYPYSIPNTTSQVNNNSPTDFRPYNRPQQAFMSSEVKHSTSK